MSKREKILTLPECALLVAIMGVQLDKNDPNNRFLPKSTDQRESPIRDLVKESYYCLQHGCPPTYRGCKQIKEEKPVETGKQLSFLDNPSFRVKEEESKKEITDDDYTDDIADDIFNLCDKIIGSDEQNA